MNQNDRRSLRIAEYRESRVTGAEITKHLRDDFLIHGWFDCGETMMVFGPSGTAKTFLLIDLCLHLGAALAWHGARCSLRTASARSST